MATRFTVPGSVPEKTTWSYAATIVDDQQQPIPRAAITELTLTLYADASKAILNGVTGTNILNVDRGSIGETDGALIVKFRPADGAILDDSLKQELHVALITCKYNGGVDQWNHEVAFKVDNLARLT